MVDLLLRPDAGGLHRRRGSYGEVQRDLLGQLAVGGFDRDDLAVILASAVGGRQPRLGPDREGGGLARTQGGAGQPAHLIVGSGGLSEGNALVPCVFDRHGFGGRLVVALVHAVKGKRGRADGKLPFLSLYHVFHGQISRRVARLEVKHLCEVPGGFGADLGGDAQAPFLTRLDDNGRSVGAKLDVVILGRGRGQGDVVVAAVENVDTPVARTPLTYILRAEVQHCVIILEIQAVRALFHLQLDGRHGGNIPVADNFHVPAVVARAQVLRRAYRNAEALAGSQAHGNADFFVVGIKVGKALIAVGAPVEGDPIQSRIAGVCDRKGFGGQVKPCVSLNGSQIRRGLVNAQAQRWLLLPHHKGIGEYILRAFGQCLLCAGLEVDRNILGEVNYVQLAQVGALKGDGLDIVVVCAVAIVYLSNIGHTGGNAQLCDRAAIKTGIANGGQPLRQIDAGQSHIGKGLRPEPRHGLRNVDLPQAGAAVKAFRRNVCHSCGQHYPLQRRTAAEALAQ